MNVVIKIAPAQNTKSAIRHSLKAPLAVAGQRLLKKMSLGSANCGTVYRA